MSQGLTTTDDTRGERQHEVPRVLPSEPISAPSPHPRVLPLKNPGRQNPEGCPIAHCQKKKKKTKHTVYYLRTRITCVSRWCDELGGNTLIRQEPAFPIALPPRVLVSPSLAPPRRLAVTVSQRSVGQP